MEGVTRASRRPVRRIPLVAVWLLFPGIARPEDSPEHTRPLCDPDQQVCIEDTIEVVFDGDSGSVLELETFEDGTTIDVTIMTETTTDRIQAWSYGVAHDEAILDVLSASIEDTTAGDLMGVGFDATSIDVETCLTESCSKDLAAGERRDGGGWLSAVVLSFYMEVYLPLGRNSLAKARYTLEKDPGRVGTYLHFSDQIARPRSPPTEFNVTVDGERRFWATAVDGWIRLKGTGEAAFRRGDIGIRSLNDSRPADGRVNIADVVRILPAIFLGGGYIFDCEKAADVDDNGQVEVTDAVYLARYLFRGGPEGPPPPAPFGEPGTDPTPDDLNCLGYP